MISNHFYVYHDDSGIITHHPASTVAHRPGHAKKYKLYSNLLSEYKRLGVDVQVPSPYFSTAQSKTSNS
jgi:hypothetical protein